MDLQLLSQQAGWSEFLRSPRLFLQIGSVYNGVPANYYREVDLDYDYDWLIYYKQTLFAEQL